MAKLLLKQLYNSLIVIKFGESEGKKLFTINYCWYFSIENKYKMSF